MTEQTVQAVNDAAGWYNEARLSVAQTLSDPEAPGGALAVAAHQAEAARAGYEQAVHEHEAEAEAGA